MTSRPLAPLFAESAQSVDGLQLARIPDAAVRSQSGRIIQNTLTDGPTTEACRYTFDAAGRLTQAVLDVTPGTARDHVLEYGFAVSTPT